MCVYIYIYIYIYVYAYIHIHILKARAAGRRPRLRLGRPADRPSTRALRVSRRTPSGRKHGAAWQMGRWADGQMGRWQKRGVGENHDNGSNHNTNDNDINMRHSLASSYLKAYLTLSKCLSMLN